MSLTYGFNLGPRGATYTAEQFTEVFGRLVSDTITAYGSGFELTLNSMLSFTVGNGYLYVNGYWLKHRYPETFTLEGAYLSGARYDALAAVVDSTERTVSLQVLTDIDPDADGQSGTTYRMYLYAFKVEAGAVELFRSNVIDKRTMLQQLDSTSTQVAAIYDYLTGSFAGEIEDFHAEMDSIMDTALDTAETATESVYTVTGLAIGALKQCPERPSPADFWLLCDGSTFTGYSALQTALDSNTLPDLDADAENLSVWIYAGIPD